MKIEIRANNKEKWMYFWVKTIESLDLAQHCARVFKGKYLNGNNIYTKEKDVYICGVSTPYVYDNNLHIALREKIGNTITIREKGLIVDIYDAERINIEPLRKNEVDNINAGRREYYTCRNWQYAIQLLKSNRFIDPKTKNLITTT